MDADRAIIRVAERQSGVFRGSQAVDAGFSRSAIRRRVRSGTWVRLTGDTYRIAGAEPSPLQPLVAAWLAAGHPAAISHLSAAAVWEMGAGPGPLPQITVPVPRHPRSPGVEVSRTTRWGRLEVVRRGIVVVTHVHRTLLDIAPLLDERKLEMVLDRAHRHLGLDLVRLDRYLARAQRSRIPGARRLRFLASLRDPARPIESELETLLFAELRRARLPLPIPQFWIRTRNGRRRLDFAYVSQKVALEVDGYEGRDLVRFEDDRARDSELADLGWDRRHITWSMLRDRPTEVMWTVGSALGLRPIRWVPART